MKKQDKSAISPTPWNIVWGKCPLKLGGGRYAIGIEDRNGNKLLDRCMRISDAHLIAVSPNLLKHLREATEYIEEHSRLKTPELMEMLTKFKSTLAKATGEEEP